MLAALFAWAWLGEGLGWLQWLGGLAVLAGIAVAARGLGRPRRAMASGAIAERPAGP